MFCEPFAGDAGGTGAAEARVVGIGGAGTPGGTDAGYVAFDPAVRGAADAPAAVLPAAFDPAGEASVRGAAAFDPAGEASVRGAGVGLPDVAGDDDGVDVPTGRFPPVIGFARGAPAGAGTMGRAGVDEGVGFTAVTPNAVGFGVGTPVGPMRIGDDARAGGRTIPAGAIVRSTDGCAVVIEPLSSGISRSSARSRSSSSGGNTDSAGPFPQADNSRDHECSSPTVRRAM
jgi:hypothetical protein